MGQDNPDLKREQENAVVAEVQRKMLEIAKHSREESFSLQDKIVKKDKEIKAKYSYDVFHKTKLYQALIGGTEAEDYFTALDLPEEDSIETFVNKEYAEFLERTKTE